MVAIILEPLAQDVTLERRYSAKLGKYAGSIKAEHIGISSPKTWHGSPDAWVKGCNVLLRSKDGEDREDEGSNSDSESDVTTGPVEMKNIDQAAGTCITSLFIECALHPRMNPLVPTILMDPNLVQICLYDCENDILLVSQAKNIGNKRGLSRTGCWYETR